MARNIGVACLNYSEPGDSTFVLQAVQILYCYYLFNCKWVSTRWQLYYNKTQHK
jgi:hypothetical protein